MKTFEDYYYQMTLEFTSLKSDDEKEQFYRNHIDEAKSIIINGGLVKGISLKFTRCSTPGKYGWQNWVKTNRDRCLFSRNAYKSRGASLMNILYGIHIGDFE